MENDTVIMEEWLDIPRGGHTSVDGTFWRSPTPRELCQVWRLSFMEGDKTNYKIEDDHLAIEYIADLDDTKIDEEHRDVILEARMILMNETTPEDER